MSRAQREQGNPCGTGSTCIEAGERAALRAPVGAGSSGGAGTLDAGQPEVTSPATVPYITSTTLNPNIGVGLSTEGTLDWAHWGLAKVGDYNHKNIPNPLLSTLASLGTKPITIYTMDPRRSPGRMKSRPPRLP